LVKSGSSAWLQRYHPCASAHLRLVCFPHAGGSAVFYRGWAAHLTPSIEVIAVQYPGRMNRLHEPLVDDIDAMADRLAGVLASGVARPFAFFGHSMGAMIAFETARRLARDHQLRPVRLFVSARKGPARHKPGERHLADDETLIGYLHKLGGCDTEVFRQPQLLPLLLPMIRSDFKLGETWAPRPDARVECPITVFIGDEDPEVTIEEAASWEHATDQFEMRVFHGHHFYLLDRQAELLDGVRRRCGVEPDRVSVS
jgi:pyochelin biosynthesis protein PchC